MTNLTRVTALAVCSALLVGPFASAGALAQYRQVVVSYAGLNLTSPTGRAVLKARLQAAASTACGKQPDIRDLARMSDYRACAKEALDGAMRTMTARLNRAEPALVAQAQ